MIHLKREINSEAERVEGYSQASFNSDGALTLRKFGKEGDGDDLIIFYREETDAIIRLFRLMRDNTEGLPF